jgi:hypothetical protein
MTFPSAFVPECGKFQPVAPLPTSCVPVADFFDSIHRENRYNIPISRSSLLVYTTSHRTSRQRVTGPSPPLITSHLPPAYHTQYAPPTRPTPAINPLGILPFPPRPTIETSGSANCLPLVSLSTRPNHTYWYQREGHQHRCQSSCSTTREKATE